MRHYLAPHATTSLCLAVLHTARRMLHQADGILLLAPDIFISRLTSSPLECAVLCSVVVHHASHTQIKYDCLALHGIASRLREARFKSGALRLNNTRLFFALDTGGNPVSASPYMQTAANFLVEEYMLLANKQVAAIIARAFPKHALLRWGFGSRNQGSGPRLRGMVRVYLGGFACCWPTSRWLPLLQGPFPSTHCSRGDLGLETRVQGSVFRGMGGVWVERSVCCWPTCVWRPSSPGPFPSMRC
jgi:hypothetical protein